MRVHLIKRQSIEKYTSKNAGSRASFGIWMSIIKRVDWEVPNDIKHTFKSADLLGRSSNRVIFNVGGNNYRMICKYHFGEKNVHLFIQWIGTHAEYTLLCKNGLQYTINIY